MSPDTPQAHIQREKLDAMWDAAQVIHHALGHNGIRLKACQVDCCYHNYHALQGEEYKINQAGDRAATQQIAVKP